MDRGGKSCASALCAKYPSSNVFDFLIDYHLSKDNGKSPRVPSSRQLLWSMHDDLRQEVPT